MLFLFSNKSYFVLLPGVKLWKLEQRPNVGTMLLKLDFQTDVVPRLLFLKEIGVEDSGLAYILSDNPFILKEDLENLQARWERKNILVNVNAVNYFLYQTLFKFEYHIT